MTHRSKSLFVCGLGMAFALPVLSGAASAQAPKEAITKEKTKSLLRVAEAKSNAKQDGAAKDQTPASPTENTTVRTETTTTYDQWVVTCRQNASDPKSCTAVLRVVQAPNQTVVLLWQIDKNKDGAIQSALQTPTGVLVQKGVEFKVGEQTISKLDYMACTPQNCEATGALDEALASKFNSLSEVTVTIHAKDGRDINFKFPIKGIDKTIAAVRG
jgi:invasion protein IalB